MTGTACTKDDGNTRGWDAPARPGSRGAAIAHPPANPGSVARRWRVARSLHAYLELTKVRLTALVVATTAVGFLMADRGHPGSGSLLATVVGTWLTAAGAMALNQWLEVARDGRMERTRNRPLPSGAIGRREGLVAGVVMAVVGLCALAVATNLLTAALGLTVVLLYTLVYTPLKTRTPVCTLAGAVCGAIPPMMGWTATGAGLGFGAWVLGGVLFLWQIPHSLALAWLYRDDYERGEFRMLPVVDRSGAVTGQMAVLYTLALLPIGILGTLGGMTGWAFALGSLVPGAVLVMLALQLASRRSARFARRLFLATLAYLPLLLGLMLADRAPTRGDPFASMADQRPRHESALVPVARLVSPFAGR